jgi:hypothetical protein
MHRIMVILRPIENESLQVFFKARSYSCHGLPLEDTSSKYGVQ